MNAFELDVVCIYIYIFNCVNKTSIYLYLEFNTVEKISTVFLQLTVESSIYYSIVTSRIQ